MYSNNFLGIKTGILDGVKGNTFKFTQNKAMSQSGGQVSTPISSPPLAPPIETDESSNSSVARDGGSTDGGGSNTMLYVGIGVGVVVLIVVAYFIFRR